MSGRPQVVLVDDDPPILRMLTALLQLETCDCLVWPFLSPTSALQRVQITDVDVVVADFRLPGMTGLELLAKVDLLRPLASTILITGDSALKHLRPSQLKHTVLYKPLSAENFQRAVLQGACLASLRRSTARLSARLPGGDKDPSSEK